MKRRENAGWGSCINPEISQAGLLKNHQISQYPQSECEGWWPFGLERIFFRIVSVDSWFGYFPSLPHVTLVFRVMYVLYVLDIGKSSFSGHTTLPCCFFCSSYKEQHSFLHSPSFPPLSIVSEACWKKFFIPSAINCLSLMLSNSLTAPHTPPLQGQTLRGTCTPLKASISG